MLEARIEAPETFNKQIEARFSTLQNLVNNFNMENPLESFKPSTTKVAPRKKVKIVNGKNSSEMSPKSFLKIGQKGSDKTSKIRSAKADGLDVSETNYSDPDKFFENFDKLFKVRNSLSEEVIEDNDHHLKVKNIRRILLDDFSVTPSRAFSCEPNDTFCQERSSVKSVTNKEKTLPQLDNVSYRPWHNLKFDYQIPETQANNKLNNISNIKDITRNTLADIANLEVNSNKEKLASLEFGSKLEKEKLISSEFGSKQDKEKLPDLKISKNFVNKQSVFSKVSNEGTEKTERIIDKINKFHEKFISKNQANTSLPNKTPIESIMIGTKARQQAFQNISKLKKTDNQRFSVAMEENKDHGIRYSQNDELRMRVNSVQAIDNSFKKNGGQRNDLSLDLGDGNNKVKFMLKNLEQRTANYYQGILNKIQNNMKDPKNLYETSRSHYNKENAGSVTNSFRDKIQEASKLRTIKEKEDVSNTKTAESVIPTKKVPVNTSRVKLGDISQLYKGIRQNSKSKDSSITVKNSLKGITGLDPIKEVYVTNIETRSNSVPRK